MKENFAAFVDDLQDRITSKLAEVDGEKSFREDGWVRAEGGRGRSRVIENGAVFEKGGVNVSHVCGDFPATTAALLGANGAKFSASGLSLVIHPKNPMVPTSHANWRYFELYNEEGELVDQWFGGGLDLTPYYLFVEDVVHFHTICKTVCDKYDLDFYPDFKRQCDEYFYNHHRQEARGVGGLFFDYCRAEEGMMMDRWYDFVTDVANAYLEAYIPIVERRKDLPYTKEQRDWQEIRRGRYVEFNLIHDRGTKFGLHTNGRVESILMSLPPHVQWPYNYLTSPGTEEARLMNVLKHPREWV